MSVFLYTENFITERFDLYDYSDGELKEVKDGPQYNKLMSQMSSLECKSEIDADGGVAVAGGIYGIRNLVYISFKILLNEVAPGGRRRALFGCTGPTEAMCWPSVLPVISAIKKLQGCIPITISEERLSLLEQCVPAAQDLSRKLVFRRQKAVDVSKFEAKQPSL